MVNSALRELSADACLRIGIEWSTVLGRDTGSCSSKLGIWTGTTESTEFTPTKWRWASEQLPAANYGSARWRRRRQRGLEGSTAAGAGDRCGRRAARHARQPDDSGGIDASGK